MNQSRTVLILGAGVGGVVAAHHLRKILPPQDKIIIFDREENQSRSKPAVFKMH